MGTPQLGPGGQSPIKPRRPVRRVRQAAKHTKATQTVGTVMENQPAKRPPSMTLSRYGRSLPGHSPRWRSSSRGRRRARRNDSSWSGRTGYGWHWDAPHHLRPYIGGTAPSIGKIHDQASGWRHRVRTAHWRVWRQRLGCLGRHPGTYDHSHSSNAFGTHDDAGRGDEYRGHG